MTLAKRENGLLAALPVGVISAEELQAGLHAQMDDVLGPSLSVEAPALDFSAGAYTPVAEASVQAVVVDLSLEAAPLCCRSAARALDFLREQPARGHSRSSHPSSACPGLGSRRRERRQGAILLSRRGGTGGSTKEAGSVASYKDRCSARRSGFNFRRWRAFSRKACPTKESGNHCQPGKPAPDQHCLVACADEGPWRMLQRARRQWKDSWLRGRLLRPARPWGWEQSQNMGCNHWRCWARRLALRKPSLLRLVTAAAPRALGQLASPLQHRPGPLPSCSDELAWSCCLGLRSCQQGC